MDSDIDLTRSYTPDHTAFVAEVNEISDTLMESNLPRELSAELNVHSDIRGESGQIEEKKKRSPPDDQPSSSVCPIEYYHDGSICANDAQNPMTSAQSQLLSKHHKQSQVTYSRPNLLSYHSNYKHTARAHPSLFSHHGYQSEFGPYSRMNNPSNPLYTENQHVHPHYNVGQMQSYTYSGLPAFPYYNYQDQSIAASSYFHPCNMPQTECIYTQLCSPFYSNSYVSHLPVCKYPNPTNDLTTSDHIPMSLPMNPYNNLNYNTNQPVGSKKLNDSNKKSSKFSPLPGSFETEDGARAVARTFLDFQFKWMQTKLSAAGRKKFAYSCDSHLDCPVRLRVIEEADKLFTMELSNDEHSTVENPAYNADIHPLLQRDFDTLLASGCNPNKTLKAIRLDLERKTDHNKLKLLPTYSQVKNRKLVLLKRGLEASPKSEITKNRNGCCRQKINCNGSLLDGTCTSMQIPCMHCNIEVDNVPSRQPDYPESDFTENSEASCTLLPSSSANSNDNFSAEGQMPPHKACQSFLLPTRTGCISVERQSYLSRSSGSDVSINLSLGKNVQKRKRLQFTAIPKSFKTEVEAKKFVQTYEDFLFKWKYSNTKYHKKLNYGCDSHLDCPVVLRIIEESDHLYRVEICNEGHSAVVNPAVPAGIHPLLKNDFDKLLKGGLGPKKTLKLIRADLLREGSNLIELLPRIDQVRHRKIVLSKTSGISMPLENMTRCNECFKRKIKCDGQTPCSKCVHKKILCTYGRPKKMNLKKRPCPSFSTSHNSSSSQTSTEEISQNNMSISEDQKVYSTNDTEYHPSKQKMSTDSVAGTRRTRKKNIEFIPLPGSFDSEKSAKAAARNFRDNQFIFKYANLNNEGLRRITYACNSHIDCPVFLRLNEESDDRYTLELADDDHSSVQNSNVPPGIHPLLRSDFDLLLTNGTGARDAINTVQSNLERKNDQTLLECMPTYRQVVNRKQILARSRFFATNSVDITNGVNVEEIDCLIKSQ